MPNPPTDQAEQMRTSDDEVPSPAADESCDGRISSSQALCLACGMCCDGTLFLDGYLRPEDRLAPLTAAGMKIAINHGQQIFTQPCAAHEEGQCTVYRDRPKVCRSYRCELLKRFTRGDISHDIAMEVIEKTKAVREIQGSHAFQGAPAPTVAALASETGSQGGACS